MNNEIDMLVGSLKEKVQLFEGKYSELVADLTLTTSHSKVGGTSSHLTGRPSTGGKHSMRVF